MNRKYSLGISFLVFIFFMPGLSFSQENIYDFSDNILYKKRKSGTNIKSSVPIKADSFFIGGFLGVPFGATWEATFWPPPWEPEIEGDLELSTGFGLRLNAGYQVTNTIDLGVVFQYQAYDGNGVIEGYSTPEESASEINLGAGFHYFRLFGGSSFGLGFGFDVMWGSVSVEFSYVDNSSGVPVTRTMDESARELCLFPYVDVGFNLSTVILSVRPGLEITPIGGHDWLEYGGNRFVIYIGAVYWP
jgi:hypothetical protein